MASEFKIGDRVVVVRGLRDGVGTFYTESKGRIATILELYEPLDNGPASFDVGIEFEDGTTEHGCRRDLRRVDEYADTFGYPDALPSESVQPPAPSISNGHAPEVDAHRHRKERPMARGVLAYFPDALMEVANVSRIGNEQHSPGVPMHWAWGKSPDHSDCILRHLVDAGTLDTDGLSHTAKVAWRALALLQTELEAADPELHARRQAMRDRAAKG